MTETEWIEVIHQVWSSDDAEAAAKIVVMRKALAKYPRSPNFLCMLGDVLQLAGQILRDDYSESIELYRRAVDIDPSFAEGWESIGFFMDVHENDFQTATDAFEKAISLGAGAQSYAGLARALAQKGRRGEAMALLTKPRCPFPDEKCIVEMIKDFKLGYWEPLEDPDDSDEQEDPMSSS